MGFYSIAQLENLSGIKSHTIRIWEQRYKLLQPSRTETNIRYYSDDELRKLMNVSALLRNGLRISEVSKLTDGEIHEKLEELLTPGKASDPFFDIYVNRFVASAIAFDEARFEKDFAFAVLRFGLEDVYIHLVLPFLERLGLMWGVKKISPVQEHFISNLIRQKIISAIDGVASVDNTGCKFVLFLPEDEDHEIGLLFANYLLRMYKIRVVYLGQRVPLQDLMEAVNGIQPQYLMTFLTRIKPVDELNKFVDEMHSNFSQVKLVIAGNSWLLSQLKNPQKILRMKSLGEFKDFCKKLQ